MLFGILTLATACQTDYVIVQRCQPLPDVNYKNMTVKQLYQDDVFVRSYLKKCTKDE